MLLTILGSFCSILDWDGPISYRPQNRLRKIPDKITSTVIPLSAHSRSVVSYWGIYVQEVLSGKRLSQACPVKKCR